MVEQIRELFLNDGISVSPAKERLLEYQYKNWDLYGTIFSKRNWMFWHIGNLNINFITCDNPVYLEDKRHQKGYYSAGIASKDIIVWFTCTKKIFAIGVMEHIDNKNEHFVVKDKSYIKQLNKAMAISADRQVYTNFYCDKIMKLSKKYSGWSPGISINGKDRPR